MRPLRAIVSSLRGGPGRIAAVAAVAVALLVGFASGYLLKGGEGSTGGHEHAASGGKAAEVWTCSMHPQIRQPGPGACPLCGMDLIPVVAEDGSDVAPRQIRLSRQARLLAEVLAAPVARADLEAEIRLVGKVDYDETTVGHITAWVPGRIDRLFVDTTGVRVRRGQSMVSLYSPELLLAQDELIQASKMVTSLAGIAAGGPGAGALSQTLDASRERLMLMGLTRKQVDAIEKSGKRRKHLTIVAPMGGVVIEKGAYQGMYVEEGTRIYTIADLSRLWIMLDAYESDIAWIELGQDVEIEVEAYPGREFSGKVSFIDPVIDPATRTARVRVEVPNEDGLLKPEMLVHALIQSDIRLPGADGEPPLVIPASAPLITGKRAVVYVEIDGETGLYEGREVVLGPRAGDSYVVLEGLEEGERVVVRGNFKIDSAMQILARPSMMSPEGGGPAPGHDHAGSPQAAPPPPRILEAPAGFLDQLDPVFAAYLAIHAALAADDADGARTAAAGLEKALDVTDMKLLEGEARGEWTRVLESLEGPVGEIASAGDIARMREAFSPISQSIIFVARAFGTTGHGPLYLKHCPMAFEGRGADWLQADPGTLNPYFGASMLRCASDVETLGKDLAGE